MKIRTILILFTSIIASVNITAQIADNEADSISNSIRKDEGGTIANYIKHAFTVKKAHADSIVGTWEYYEPVVLVTSGNLLYRVVGNAVADKLKSLLSNLVVKGNIKSGNTSITFNEDGTYVRQLAGHTANGTWMMNDEKLLISIHNVLTATLITHMDSNRVILLADATKIVEIVRALGGHEDKKHIAKTLTMLTKKLKGIGGGFVLVRKRE